MLHDDSFSLYEAMSAVEIGDPKLDAGMAHATEPLCALASLPKCQLAIQPDSRCAAQDSGTRAPQGVA